MGCGPGAAGIRGAANPALSAGNGRQAITENFRRHVRARHAMTTRQTPLLVHLVGAAMASAAAAFWILRLLTPAPAAAPAPAVAPLASAPDPVLAARIFGDVNTGPALAVRNIQVLGVFAAGRSSSAVIAVDGRPARAVLLGQDAAAGLRLVEVQPDGVTLESDGSRTHYAVAAVNIARATAPSALFRRDGNTLTAPSLDAAPAGRPVVPPPVVRPGGASPGPGMLQPPGQRGERADGGGPRPGAGGFGGVPPPPGN